MASITLRTVRACSGSAGEVLSSCTLRESSVGTVDMNRAGSSRRYGSLGTQLIVGTAGEIGSASTFLSVGALCALESGRALGVVSRIADHGGSVVTRIRARTIHLVSRGHGTAVSSSGKRIVGSAGARNFSG